ncbi:MAG: SBBP repeat-containing protein [Acidobacteria bacterium]|nr:SBBP repeat-containing protein [Acidobacteriota bacterium]
MTGSCGLVCSFIYTLTCSSGREDIFLAKYDAAGNVLWARRAGGSDDDLANGVAVDGSGNAYVTGFFDGTATFGTTTLTKLCPVERAR